MDGSLFFFLGTLRKGIAGSIIASQRHSLFRALLPPELPLNQLPERIKNVACFVKAALRTITPHLFVVEQNATELLNW